MQAIETKSNQDLATYRLILKRAICATGLECIKDYLAGASTAQLEGVFLSQAKLCPAGVSEALEKRWEMAAKLWVDGNNSGDPFILAQKTKSQEQITDALDRVMSLLEIEVDYPGLYPSFKVGGYGYHCALSAIRAALGTEGPSHTPGP